MADPKKKPVDEYAALRAEMLKDAEAEAATISQIPKHDLEVFRYPGKGNMPPAQVTVPGKRSEMGISGYFVRSGESDLELRHYPLLGNEFSVELPVEKRDEAARLGGLLRSYGERVRQIRDPEVRSRAGQLLLDDARKRLDALGVSYPSQTSSLYELAEQATVAAHPGIYDNVSE